MGMLVAILDTGVDMGHEIFKTAPKSPSLTREKLQSTLEQYDFQVEQIIRGISVSDLYYSAKIPFQFDYGDRDKDGMPAIRAATAPTLPPPPPATPASTRPPWAWLPRPRSST